jgi:periplasmic divalent cation tolerance protein
MPACVVLVTVPNQAVGEQLAQALVTLRLAACVNRVPGLISLYHWQGKIEKDAEELLIIKTRLEYLPALEAKIKSMHPYQVPEVIALSIVGGAAPYLDWLEKETANADLSEQGSYRAGEGGGI